MFIGAFVAKTFGALKGKTIRVLDIGSGTGEWIASKAAKNKKGIYVAVDPAYRGYPVNPATRAFLKKLEGRGVVLRGATARGYLQTMVRNNIRVRTINADMPNWKSPATNYIHDLLFLAPKVLVPGGRIFMTIESSALEKEAIRKEIDLAARFGFSVKKMALPAKSAGKTHMISDFKRAYSVDIALVIFTLAPKKRGWRLP